MKKHVSTRVAWALVFSLATLGCGSAQAASFSSWAVCGVGEPYTGVGSDCPTIDQKSELGLQPNRVLSTSFKAPASEGFVRDYTATVRSGPGNLGSEVKAELSGNMPAGIFLYAGGTAIAYATYTDTLLVSSATLAPGTPVKVDFSQVLSFAMSRNTQAAPQSMASGQTSVYLEFKAEGVSSASYTRCLGDFYADCTPFAADGSAHSFTYDVSVDSYVGGSINISAGLSTGTFLSVSNNGYVGAGYVESRSIVSSLNSAHTFVSTQAAGIDFVAESGHNYALAPVPEPTQLALLLAGLGLLAVRARQRPSP